MPYSSPSHQCSTRWGDCTCVFPGLIRILFLGCREVCAASAVSGWLQGEGRRQRMPPCDRHISWGWSPDFNHSLYTATTFCCLTSIPCWWTESLYKGKLSSMTECSVRLFSSSPKCFRRTHLLENKWIANSLPFSTIHWGYPLQNSEWSTFPSSKCIRLKTMYLHISKIQKLDFSP